MIYNDLVLSHFDAPRNVGTLAASDADTVCVQVGTASAGNVAQLSLKVKDGHIRAAKFKAYGEPFVIAGCSYLTELLIDKPLATVEKIDHSVLVDALELPMTKLHTALLVEDLLKAALQKWLQTSKTQEAS